jgi:hypothetical protein
LIFKGFFVFHQSRIESFLPFQPLSLLLLKKIEGMSDLKLFEDKKIRSHWDAEAEKWFFSITDVIGVLTESPNPRNYWKVLKHRMIKEGSESVTNCNQLKMQSADGKFYLTDVADTEQLFRLIQSIPSRLSCAAIDLSIIYIALAVPVFLKGNLPYKVGR